MSGRYLLDTHVFLRMADPDQRRSRTNDILQDPDTELVLSVVTIAEIMIKNGIGKLPLPAAIERAPGSAIRQATIDAGFQWLSLEPEHVSLLRTLPLHHKDPFDRLLICQAMAENLILVSDDRAFPLYSGLSLLRS